MKRTSLLVTLAICLTATALLADSYEPQIASMSQSLASSAVTASRKKIAVMALTDLQGRERELGSFLAEALTVNLINLGISNKTFTVVDREHLKLILTEQKIAVSGIMNPETVKKLGLISGADAFIIGNITELQDEFSISVKLIGFETAENLGADRRKVTKTQELVKLWESSKEKVIEPEPPRPPIHDPGQPAIAKGTWEGVLQVYGGGGSSTARMGITNVIGNNFKGVINFADMRNSILTLDGEVCTSFGDFTEQSRWQFVAQGKKFRDGKWVKLKLRKLTQGDFNPNKAFYCSLTDGELKGSMFTDEDPNPQGKIELRFSE